MEISPFKNNVQFTSRLNPVTPFTFKTKAGKIRIYEAQRSEINRHGFARELMTFFTKNLASVSEHPSMSFFHNPEKAGICSKIIKFHIDRFWNLIKNDDGTLTLLLAKDKFNKLRGACLSYGYKDVPTAAKTTCFIDSIAVDGAYRGCRIGENMLKRVLRADKKTFTDVFLTGETKSRGFYDRFGFVELDPFDETQSKVIDFIAMDDDGYPEYVDFLTMPLQNNKPRWYKTASKAIDKISEFYDEE